MTTSEPWEPPKKLPGYRGGSKKNRDQFGRKIPFRAPGSSVPLPPPPDKPGLKLVLGKLEREAFPSMKKPTGRMPNPNLMTDAQLLDLVKRLARADSYDWRANARPSQVQPESYRTWLIMAGRGFGKTRAAAEAVREWCQTPNTRVAVIAKGSRELRDVCFEGVSGLISVFPPEEVKHFYKGLGDNRLILENGSMIIGFSAETPDAIRGQSFDGIWGDEFAAWPRHLAEDMLTQAWMTLRESKDPRAILATTPKRVAHVTEMLDRAKNDPSIVVTRGSTMENTALSQVALDELYGRYGGTAMGKQELEGVLLEAIEGALWMPEHIDSSRWGVTEEEVDLPKFKKTYVAVDPSGSATGDATGIAVTAITFDRRIFVLGCYSIKAQPGERYGAICKAAEKHRADSILVEYNFGGDNAIFGIDKQWRHMVEVGQISTDAKKPTIEKSTLKGSKAVKAGPVAALYEQQHNINVQRIRHVQPTLENRLDELESQLISWVPTDKESPNSLDALVIGARRCMRDLGWSQEIGQVHVSRRLNDGWRPFR